MHPQNLDRALLDNLVPLVPELARPLPRRARVAILGGGIIGVFIAYHLAAAGVRDVVLLERDRLGSGSSAKPLGGVRAAFSDPGNIVLGRRSLEFFERVERDFRADIGLRQVGYLFLARTPEEFAALQESAEVQRSYDNEVRIVTPAEAASINPFLEAEALVGAAFTPRDGYVQPARVVAAFAAEAERHGAAVFEHTEVLGLGAHDDAVEIRTQRGSITVETVIIAAGAWSTALGAQLGVHLPIEPVRRQIGFTPQLDTPHPTVPFTLDLSTTLYFHNHRNGLLLGISNQEQPGFQRSFSYNWTTEFDRAAEIIAPSLARQPLESGWAGLYENTPDHNALIGRDEHLPSVLYATGFSGHGLLQGPAVGELIRDLYLGRESFLDPAPFSARRFSGDRSVLSELHII